MFPPQHPMDHPTAHSLRFPVYNLKNRIENEG